MQPLRRRAATAAVIAVCTGIFRLLLRLAGLPVHRNIIHLYIPASCVIGEINPNGAAIGSGKGIIGHAGGQGPGF